MTKIQHYGLCGALILFAFTLFYFISYPTEYQTAKATSYIKGATPSDLPPGVP